jgi:hypothetical protein
MIPACGRRKARAGEYQRECWASRRPGPHVAPIGVTRGLRMHDTWDGAGFRRKGEVQVRTGSGRGTRAILEHGFSHSGRNPQCGMSLTNLTGIRGPQRGRWSSANSLNGPTQRRARHRVTKGNAGFLPDGNSPVPAYEPPFPRFFQPRRHSASGAGRDGRHHVSFEVERHRVRFETGRPSSEEERHVSEDAAGPPECHGKVGDCAASSSIDSTGLCLTPAAAAGSVPADVGYPPGFAPSSAIVPLVKRLRVGHAQPRSVSSFLSGSP